jgi:hypothetical protein
VKTVGQLSEFSQYWRARVTGLHSERERKHFLSFAANVSVVIVSGVLPAFDCIMGITFLCCNLISTGLNILREFLNKLYRNFIFTRPQTVMLAFVG